MSKSIFKRMPDYVANSTECLPGTSSSWKEMMGLLPSNIDHKELLGGERILPIRCILVLVCCTAEVLPCSENRNCVGNTLRLGIKNKALILKGKPNANARKQLANPLACSLPFEGAMIEVIVLMQDY